MLTSRRALNQAVKITKRFNSSKSPESFIKPNVEFSTLPNGIRVITDSTPSHFSALGCFIDAGTRYENPAKPGLSHLWDRLAWSSTETLKGSEMVESLSRLGGNYMAAAQRESMIYQASVFNNDVDKMFDLIAQTVRAPSPTDEEIHETLKTAEYELLELPYKHDVLLPEVLHTAAYQNNTLGLPLYSTPERLREVTRDELMEYHNKFFQPQNVVVSMVGVSHEYALKLAQSHFGDWKQTQPKSVLGEVTFTGGELALPYQPPMYSNLPELYHMQIGFETSGLLDDELYALATLQKLLGGGSSFSAGGPGKGMYSRLYRRVLNQYPFVENCMAFNHSYVNSGLFGVTISCEPNAAHVMSQVVCAQLSGLLEKDPKKGGLEADEVARAKNQLKSSLLMNMESRLSKLEDMGRQVQCQNKVTSIDQMVDRIESLTIENLRNVAEKVLTGNVVTKGISSGKAAVAMQGDREKFGDINVILNTFGLGRNASSDIPKPRAGRWIGF